MDRRAVLTGGLGAALAPLFPRARAADAAAAKDVTLTLARYAVKAAYADIPEKVRKEGVRTLVNWLGAALGGSSHEAVNDAVAALAPLAGPAQASLVGRKERFDIRTAAFINGIASHVLDYDDTHLKTVIHPSVVICPALLAAAEWKPVNGKDFLAAQIVGTEAALRVGNAVYPNHYDVGWHITGTAGVFGAAVAVGRLLGLTEQQMVYALGLAASQPVGLRESFGSMNKSFNPGAAASAGILAALLASKGFDSSPAMIEARRGWANTISTKQDYGQITEGLGTRFEAALNTYKPFPCGIVLHPPIDAALRLRRANKIDPAAIDRVELKVHPLVLELTGKPTPADGLESKFSVYHAVAVAIIEGAGGLKQFSDRAAKDPAVLALRAKVKPVVTQGIHEEQVDMTIVMKDGTKFHQFIEHAVGSVEAPLSDADLNAKVTELADGILPAAQAKKAFDICWNVEKLASAAEIAAASRGV